jgi:hypothetical protein
VREGEHRTNYLVQNLDNKVRRVKQTTSNMHCQKNQCFEVNSRAKFHKYEKHLNGG